MKRCRVCWDEWVEVCDRCKVYHCEEHPCSLPTGPEDRALFPILVHTASEGDIGAPTEVVRTEEVHHEDPVQEEEQATRRLDHAKGGVAALFLGAWIAYATYSERRGSGFGHERMQATKALDQFSRMLLPTEYAGTNSLSVVARRRYYFGQGFKFGVLPTPMPFPRVFASWADIALTVRLGIFSAFAPAEDFARFRELIEHARPSRALASTVGKSIVAERGNVIRYGGAGYVAGTGLYSGLYNLVASRVGIPFVQGVMTSSVLSLQIPWDACMIFNQYAVQVGENSRILQNMSSTRYNVAMNVVRTSLKPICLRMFGVGAAATTGLIVLPQLMKTLLSGDEKR